MSAEAYGLVADAKFRAVVAGLLVAFLAVFTRCCYRIAEMAGGWANPIMQDEIDFIVLDGVMVLVASLCLSLFHPGFCFPRLSMGGASRLRDVEKRVSESSLEQA